MAGSCCAESTILGIRYMWCLHRYCLFVR